MDKMCFKKKKSIEEKREMGDIGLKYFSVEEPVGEKLLRRESMHGVGKKALMQNISNKS